MDRQRFRTNPVPARKRTFLPTLDGRLEPRIALATAFSAAVKQSFVPPATFGGGQVDPSIPLLRPFNGINNPNVQNPYQGIPIGFNFTSGTFYTIMVKGYQGTPGLLNAMARYTKSGNSGILYQQLSQLAGHVPYGVASGGLLYAWALGLYTTGRLPTGARLNGPAPTSPAPPGPLLTNAQVGQLMETTFLHYLQNGIGQFFNIMKSQGSHPTDVLLTFNGKV
jgi:hypothetical protein